MNDAQPPSLAADLGLRLVNTLTASLVISAACLFYALLPVHQSAMHRSYGGAAIAFTGWEFLIAASGFYALLIACYYGLERAPRPAKSLVFLRVCYTFVRDPDHVLRRGLTRDERLAVLTTTLKAFFAPLMVVSLMIFAVESVEHGRRIIETASIDADFLELFNRHGYWFLMRAILFIDVLLFTIGYLIELPRLGNEIRSVDPTVIGWAAALLCYPPFNTLTAFVLGSPVDDFPKFDDPMTHVVLNVLLLVLMAVYAAASVALGFKASNLTHRGIVARGPYAWIRHPAYTCKNLAWWIGSLPALGAAFAQSWVAGFLGVCSVAGWTALYVLRALTEEDHLRSVDGEYAAYAARVRYRFVPGLV